MKFFILFIVVILPCIYANWCGLPSCSGREHVDCTMANGQFAPACSDSAVMLNMDNAQAAILHKHNNYRNQIAGGFIANKFSAVRMGTMRWNATLANLARKNVKKCTFTKDQCSNTPNFDFVGQNIARAVVPTTDPRSNFDIVLGLIDSWFNQHINTSMANIRSYPQPGTGPVIENFCQMVRDYSTRVGCGGLKYTQGTNSVLLFTCVYDLAPMVEYPVYVDGPVGRDCRTGRNTTYTNLCSVNEVYNVNNFWENF